MNKTAAANPQAEGKPEIRATIARKAKLVGAPRLEHSSKRQKTEILLVLDPGPDRPMVAGPLRHVFGVDRVFCGFLASPDPGDHHRRGEHFLRRGCGPGASVRRNS